MSIVDILLCIGISAISAAVIWSVYDWYKASKYDDEGD